MAKNFTNLKQNLNPVSPCLEQLGLTNSSTTKTNRMPVSCKTSFKMMFNQHPHWKVNYQKSPWNFLSNPPTLRHANRSMTGKMWPQAARSSKKAMDFVSHTVDGSDIQQAKQWMYHNPRFVNVNGTFTTDQALFLAGFLSGTVVLGPRPFLIIQVVFTVWYLSKGM